MPVEIHQSKVINNLNNYLKWHNLPVRMNESGICNGLASVYAKYVLEGRQDEFMEKLSQIATMTTRAELDSHINHFVTEIVLSFLPQQFNKELSQSQSIETLQIDGKKLSSSFDFGMVTSDKKWISILQELQLRENEALIVRSLNHAITITKEKDGYKVYDPNYQSGFRIFPDEKSLIHELHHNVFRYTGQLAQITDPLGITQELSSITAPLGLNGPLGMGIQVIRHPSLIDTPREFPDVNVLYNQFLDPNQIAQSGNRRVSNSLFVIEADNVDALNLMYKKGFDGDPIDLICTACGLNKTKTLAMLLDKVTTADDSKLGIPFLAALGCGHEEAFNVLLSNSKFKTCFENSIILEKNALKNIKMAAVGGNEVLLERMISSYKSIGKPTPLTDVQIAEKILTYSPEDKGDVIKSAMDSGSTACVNLLLKQLDKTQYKCDEKQLLTYLTQAIKSNQPHMVNLFVDKIKKEMNQESQHKIFKAIEMSTTAVEKTDLSILRQLKESGVTFSKTAEGVINQKEQRPVGLLLKMGIMLHQFTDFIKETIFQSNEVQNNIRNFMKAKNSVTELKSNATPESNESSEFTPSLINRP
ncbi:hypothetical protein [Legionella fallonii]|uniref:Substrate of the dot/icm secretion system n=1 Tax=Legionella fallonii LLAP-10 TaxID=1212491 RepID=A0A098G5K8_9GAMM|nr:hypothetical protein [Legionella fallonii]CEG57264.1 substrate of the dot/icm secretion system [Legionella fallonii LLAP-10]